MKIKILSTGYYDTKNEKWALLKEGDILTVAENQDAAPCRSKQGNGLWTDCGKFVENENMDIIE